MRNIVTILVDLAGLLWKALETPEGLALLTEIEQLLGIASTSAGNPPPVDQPLPPVQSASQPRGYTSQAK